MRTALRRGRQLWSERLLLLQPRACLHPLSASSRLLDSGRRHDPAWLVHIFHRHIFRDPDRDDEGGLTDEGGVFESLSEFTSLSRRLDALESGLDDFQLLLAPTNQVGHTFCLLPRLLSNWTNLTGLEKRSAQVD